MASNVWKQCVRNGWRSGHSVTVWEDLVRVSLANKKAKSWDTVSLGGPRRDKNTNARFVMWEREKRGRLWDCSQKVLQILWGARGRHVPGGKLIVTQQRREKEKELQMYKRVGGTKKYIYKKRQKDEAVVCKGPERIGNTHTDLIAGKASSCVTIFKLTNIPVQRTKCPSRMDLLKKIGTFLMTEYTYFATYFNEFPRFLG